MTLNDIVVEAIKGAMKAGPSAESESVENYTPEALATLLPKYQDMNPGESLASVLTEDEQNLLVHVLLDLGSYGTDSDNENALRGLDVLCPEAAKDLREDKYLFRYLRLDDEIADSCPIH